MVAKTRRASRTYCSLVCKANLRREHASASALMRILSHVRVAHSDECWEWAGHRLPHGYGLTSFDGKRTTAHRALYQAMNGRLDPSMLVCHHCDNPPCCNPAHLFVGSIGDNMRDMVAKGRTYAGPRNWGAFGDKNGSVTHPERRPRGANHFARARPHLVARGEACATKLSERDVVRMRELRASGATLQQVANQFGGLSPSYVRRVCLRRAWAHVA